MTDAVQRDSLRSTVLFAAAVVLTVSVLQVTGHLGAQRSGLTVWGTASAVAAGAVWWAVRTREASPSALEAVLAGLAVLPGTGALLEAAVTQRVAPTVLVVLSVVAVGAVVSRGRLAAAVVAAVVGAWVVVVVARRVGPADAVTDHVLGLVLACALAYVAFDTRRRTQRRLARAGEQLDQRLGELTAAWEVVEGSNRRFHGVFTGSPVGIGLADEQGRFVEVNDALCRLLGRPAAELLGRSSVWITHPDDQAVHGGAGALIDGAAHGVARIEKRYVRPDGSSVWVLLTMSHVPGPEGQRWTLAHYLDVTERRRVDSALERSRTELEAIAAVAQCGLSGTDPRPVVVGSVLRLAAATTVALVEPEQDDLVVTACAGADATGVRTGIGSTSLTALAFSSGQRVLSPDVVEDARADPALGELTASRAVLCEPVRGGTEVLGVLVVAWDVPLDGLDEGVSRAIGTLAAEAGAAVQAERMRARLRRQARTDPLTGLLNRRGWLDDASRVAAQAHRRGDVVGLVLADLDHFKSYNDAHGHQRGDELLRRFADACTEHVREVDVVGRWGGEEFVLALPGCDVPDVLEVLARVRGALPEGRTASFGVRVWDDGTDVEEALKAADEAMYAAKQEGRDRVVVAGDAVTG